MSSLPTEVWTVIAQHVRQPLPPAGEEGITRAQLHQQDLVNLMRVSITTHHATAPVLYSEIVVDDLSLLYVGVGKARQQRLRLAAPDSVHKDGHTTIVQVNAKEPVQMRAAAAVGPINKLDLLNMVTAIHYVYPAPEYYWTQLLRSNRQIQGTGIPLRAMFPQLERQTFCSWIWPSRQLAQYHFEFLSLGAHIDNDENAIVYRDDILQRAKYDFAAGQFGYAHTDYQMAVTVPVPVSAYRCVSQQADGPLMIGDSGRQWRFHPANQSDVAGRIVTNAVHDVDLACPGRMGDSLVAGMVNHIYLKEGTVKDEAISTQWTVSAWESLVDSFFTAGDLWGTETARKEEIKRTRLVIYLPRPRSSHIIYERMGIEAKDDLERINTIIRNAEIKLGDRPVARVLAPREVKQRVTVAWAEEVPWCMACKRPIPAVTRPVPIVPAPPSWPLPLMIQLEQASPQPSPAEHGDDYFFDFGDSSDELESIDDED